jgi:hypothetical protein
VGLATLLGDAVVDLRHTAAWFPIFALVPFSAIDAARWKTNAAIAWTIATVAISGVVLGVQYAPMAKQGDFARVAKYLERNAKTEQPIAVFHCELGSALAHHYRGASPIVPIPRPMRADQYDLQTCMLSSSSEVRAVLSAAGATNGFWLVDSGERELWGVNLEREHLDDVLRTCFFASSRRQFYGSLVTEFRPNGRCAEF